MSLILLAKKKKKKKKAGGVNFPLLLVLETSTSNWNRSPTMLLNRQL